jgi:hypothetical protein
MRKVLLGCQVVMLLVLGLGRAGRAAPPPPTPQTREVGENNFCKYHTIAAAIADANPGDTIKVQNYVFDEPSLNVSESLHFIGGYGKALYGDQACLTLTGTGRATVRPGTGVTGPLFHVQAGARVRVEWFVFENGASEGVAVDGGGLLTLENSIVQNNSDGGLTVVGATANLLETEILGNDRDYGGGIFMDSAARVTASASLIQDNQGWQQGAGVYLRGGSAFGAVDGTSIELNVTPVGCEDGGGIAAIGSGTTVTIDASQVLGNTALTRGGGLYLAGGAQAWIQNGSMVQENRTYGPTVGGGGGAHVTGNASFLDVTDSVFYLNSSDPNGGGIYADLGTTVHVSGSLFYQNLGGDFGGGIYNSGGSVTCRGSVFYQNRVVDYHGGAIYSIGIDDTLDVEQCGFYNNTTDSGNGGAIYAKHPWTSVRRSYFTANTALGEGSALFLSGMDIPGSPQAEVINSYIVNNPTLVPVPDIGEQAPAGDGSVPFLSAMDIPGSSIAEVISSIVNDPTQVPVPDIGEQAPAGIEGGSTSGSSLYAEHTTAYLTHNTIAHPSQVIQYGALASDYSTVYLVNNIITGFSIAIGLPLGGTGAANASHTLFWNNGSNHDSGVSSSDEVIGDPIFVSSSNYNLTAASPAINAGTATTVGIDYYGSHRPWGGWYDIGAEEYPRQKFLFLPLIKR